MIVDILCSVVDNLGDIGFVYRLARALTPSLQIRLIVDDLLTFAAICEEVDASLSVQTLSFGSVIQWNNPGEEGLLLFRNTKPRIVIETYACGRPSWFEDILFDSNNQSLRYIINIDYLTAEDWAKEFHLLPSFTRSSLVSKIFFMPGFVQGTGGILQDTESVALRQLCKTPSGREQLRKKSLLALGNSAFLNSVNIDSFWIFIFTYEHDFTHIIQDLAFFHSYKPLTVILASGRSAEPFLTAWKSDGSPFPVFVLPSVPQQIWDSILASVDFAFVRGEESFAQVSLSGIPFVWECYPFLEKSPAPHLSESLLIGHWPKVEAFLKLISPYMNTELFLQYEKLTKAFNGITPLESGCLLSFLLSLDQKEADEGSGTQKHPSRGLNSTFRDFSQSVQKVGNLATNLLEYIRKIK